MDIVERYLQAVKFWLPKDQSQDIIAELSEDLHSQIEEEQARVGRALTAAEAGAILKRRGRPVLVANRYLPQQHLIGPVLYPVYIFVLKIVGLCYLVPWLLVWIGLRSFGPEYREGHPVSSLWGSLWLATFVAVSTVTIVFAVLERVQAKSHFLEEWDPNKLPPVRDPNQIQRLASLIEIAASLFAIGWFLTYMTSPLVFGPVEVDFAPVWRSFFWGFLLVSFGNLALAAVNVTHPYWSVNRAAARLGLDLAGSALFCWLMKAEIVVAITVANVPVGQTAAVAAAINLWAGRSFPVAVIAGVAIACGNLYRIVRVSRGNRGPAQPLIAQTTLN